MGASQLKVKRNRWPLSNLALAVIISLSSAQALALSLGRAQVLSALGEPLKAEIDILDMTAGEASTLTTRIADPEAFRMSGLDYSAAMPGIQLRLARRTDGRSFIQLTGRQPINEPFLDLILEAKWSSGRILRDYTLLFDPPQLKPQAAPAVAASAVKPPAAVQIAPAPAAVVSAPAAPKAAPTQAAKPQAPATTARAPSNVPAPAKSAPADVRVQRGDTAGKIALRAKSADVSLDQMLLAMLRANPDAFIDGNINLIKAGALVKLPTAAEAQQTSTAEARQLIRTQSKDFNQYRQSLAANAPKTTLDAAQRDAKGQVSATVEDKKPAAATPDKLTLTQATVQGKRSEDQVAQGGNQQEAADKAQALAKNVSDLDKLAATAGNVASGTPATQASPDASKTSGTAIPMAAAPQPAVPAAAPAQGGLIDVLLDDPLIPAGAAGVLALLIGWVAYRSRQRKKTYEIDSVLAEARLEDDSFFGTSSVKEPDTRDNPETGSSMFYSASQIDTSEEADPTEEAAVYMAYGRDHQAEEILKEALQENPKRISIHRKLLEIYAQRQDAASFEQIATLAKDLTQGAGSDWEAITRMGQKLQPDNSLYADASAPARPAPASTPTEDAATTQAPRHVDLDLDLEAPAQPEAPDEEPAFGDDLQAPAASQTAAQESPSTDKTDASPSSMDLDFPLDMTEESGEQSDDSSDDKATASAAKSSAPDNNLVEFDLGDLSLDLNEPAADLPEDSLEAKLAQAEALEAKGDHEGARALIQEVIANASGDVKAKAKDTLDKL